MAGLARVVAPGIPHHITQRGNRRQETFFCTEDYQAYIALMREWCRACAVEVWAYCLMPNHVHVIAVPDSGDGLRRAIGEAHRRYTRRVNFREGWRGHLWQGHVASCPLDEPHVLAAARYIEQNPVRAGLAAKPWDYPWSSARAHMAGSDDTLVNESIPDVLPRRAEVQRRSKQAYLPHLTSQSIPSEPRSIELQANPVYNVPPQKSFQAREAGSKGESC